MLWWNVLIELVVSKQVVRCFDEEQLQHAFHNNLLEDAPTLSERDLSSWLLLLGGRQRRWDDGLAIRFCQAKSAYDAWGDTAHSPEGSCKSEAFPSISTRRLSSKS